MITEGEGIVIRKPGRQEREEIPHRVNRKIEELSKLVEGKDAPEIKSKFKEIVPEYQPYAMNGGSPPDNKVVFLTAYYSGF